MERAISPVSDHSKETGTRPPPGHGLSRLERLWLCEAVRLREEQAGPLEDGEAVRRARLAGATLAQRLEARALWLAERDGQLQALRHWRQGAGLALALLLVAAVFTGVGLAFAALGDGRGPVNVFWALGSLLGLNLLMLLLWLLSLPVMQGSGGALGRIWLWLSAKLARDAGAAQLAPALLVLLQRGRLSQWGIGMLSHGLWLLALASALVMLLLLLATRRYDFVWETTLLSADAFVALTRGLGALPATLGFPVPTLEIIRASGEGAVAAEAARRAWSGWLLGVLVLYGLLPRLLLSVLCWWRWRRGLAGLVLDPELPGYSLLRERLLPSSERLALDQAPPVPAPVSPARPLAAAAGGAVVVGIEIDDRYPWPPPLPASVLNAGVVDSREQRRALLDALAMHPPARLLIACDPRRSPDRGTLNLLAELARTAAAVKVWLLPVDAGLEPARLEAWQEALGRLQLPLAETLPQQWLEEGEGS